MVFAGDEEVLSVCFVGVKDGQLGSLARKKERVDIYLIVVAVGVALAAQMIAKARLKAEEKECPACGQHWCIGSLCESEGKL